MEKILIVYWSGTGNTEAMAKAVAEGAKGKDNTVDVFLVSDFDVSKIGDYDKLALGCPSMGDEVLEESEFEPFFTQIENQISGKNTALFGSYGWGDGAWMRDWQDRVQTAGGRLFEEGLTALSTPDDPVIEQCRDFGKRFAAL